MLATILEKEIRTLERMGQQENSIWGNVPVQVKDVASLGEIATLRARNGELENKLLTLQNEFDTHKETYSLRKEAIISSDVPNQGKTEPVVTISESRHEVKIVKVATFERTISDQLEVIEKLSNEKKQLTVKTS